ncbi:hypothetical protein ACIQXD_18405 [Streptomyces uncialis]|uniref:hypothetical protein n=1 Tax=Streptomyces uncialis TaxID=1048205 RepID=UPI0038238DCD
MAAGTGRGAGGVRGAADGGERRAQPLGAGVLGGDERVPLSALEFGVDVLDRLLLGY